ncbi:unnamed protein product [Leptidea sinapis]|uniref:Metaxin glutathione S-transferase domain-containing protein n=1 Tax=Leptidea sinapis TaxID=189913 RepID=A0A5E4PNQ6_9NEOP|nr:unnamed protein product [Leptidea sinapis]
MSVYNLWDKELKEPKLKLSLSNDWSFDSPIATPRSSSPTSRAGDSIFRKYNELIHSKSNLANDAKQTEPLERPFDFDDEEFAFGIDLLNKNVACVGDNITKLIQMAQEPWPDNVKLFQPYEVEQILLPDNASCLAVQAFLKMCNLPFEVEMRWNAEFMSPSGRVPFIKCGAFVVSELEPIVQFAAHKGVSLCSKLSNEEKAELRAYMTVHILGGSRNLQHGDQNKEFICVSLAAWVAADQIQKEQPTELDALVFGHVFTIITTRLPCRKLADTVRRHESLVALAKRIDEQYFKRP